MKQITGVFTALIISLAFNGCKKPCEKSLRLGEIVQIPIEFKGFSISEIDNILVYRIDNSNPSLVDTFTIRSILWANMARSTSEIITDREQGQNQFGKYESYFDNCTLIFDWYSGKDTLSNFEVKKSKENIEGCHENDPNVKIDILSFVHKGNTIFKGESISIDK